MDAKRIEELKQLWHEAARNNAPNKMELFKAYADAKIDYACETSGFNKTCEEFKNACEKLRENNKEFYGTVIDGLTQSANNFNKALAYSNKTIDILTEITQK